MKCLGMHREIDKDRGKAIENGNVNLRRNRWPWKSLNIDVYCKCPGYKMSSNKLYLNIQIFNRNWFIKFLWSNQPWQTQLVRNCKPLNMSQLHKGFRLWILILLRNKHWFLRRNKSQLFLPISGCTSKEILARFYCTLRKWVYDQDWKARISL